MGADLLAKYAGLSSNYKIYDISYLITMFASLGAFLALTSLIAQFTQTPFNQSSTLVPIVSFVSLGVIATVFFVKARDTKVSANEISAIKAYRAYDAVSKFISTPRPAQEKNAKLRVSELITEIIGWVGPRMPLTMAKPVNDLLGALRGRVLPKIEEGNVNDMHTLRGALETLLYLLDSNATLGGIQAVVEKLEAMPPPTKPVVTEQFESEPSVRQKSVTKNKILKSIFIMVASIAGAFLWYYFLPLLLPSTYAETVLGAQLNGFVVIFALGVTSVIAYLWRSQ